MQIAHGAVANLKSSCVPDTHSAGPLVGMGVVLPLQSAKLDAIEKSLAEEFYFSSFFFFFNDNGNLVNYSLC